MVHLFSIAQERIISSFAAGGSSSAKTPVIQMSYNRSGTLLALATGDSKIRIYSLAENRFISQLQSKSSSRGSGGLSPQVHTGRISLLKFSTDSRHEHILVSSALDGVRVWNVSRTRGEQLVSWLNRDLGDVISVEFCENNDWMITGGDEVLKVYDYSEMETRGLKETKTIPVPHTISGIVLVDEERVAVSSIDHGDVTVWNLNTEQQEKSSASSSSSSLSSNKEQSDEEDENDSDEDSDDSDDDNDSDDDEEDNDESSNSDSIGQYFNIVQMHYAPQCKTFLCVTQDGNFLFYSYPELRRERQVVGFNDEVLDVCLLLNNKRQKELMASSNSSSEAIDAKELLIATNSEKILRVNLQTKSVQFLCGHREVVLGLASDPISERFAVSVSKDRTVRVWDLKHNRCVAVGDAHSKSVSSVVFARTNKRSFFVTASDDKTVKVWDMSQVTQHMSKFDKSGSFSEKDIIQLTPEKSVNAHTKEINQIALSPNDEFLATASSDKTVKIWKVESMDVVRTIQHPKGVYAVSFSPIDKTIVTGCSDSMARIHSLTNGNLLKVFSQDTMHGVLKVAFIRNGAQLVTIDASGLLKLWSIKYGNCLANFDEHSDRVWGLAVLDKMDNNFMMITGGEDSKVNIWRDSTLEVVQEQKREIDEAVRMEQQLKNLTRNKKYLEAIQIAIKADRPRQVYILIEQFLGLKQDKTGTKQTLGDLIKSLEYTDVMTLFQYTIDWNTNSKFCAVAQRVLYAMFNNLDPSFINTPYEKSVQALLGYSEKHAKRVQQLLQRSYLLDYVLSNMKMMAPQLNDESTVSLHTPAVEKVKIVDPEAVVNEAETEERKVEQSKQPESKRKLEESEVSTPAKKKKLESGESQSTEKKTPASKKKVTPKPKSSAKKQKK